MKIKPYIQGFMGFIAVGAVSVAVVIAVVVAVVVAIANNPAPVGKVQVVLPERVTYYWTDLGIKTSDGRFFPLKRENIRDKNGNPVIIMEALVTGGSNADKMPQRVKMDEAELTNDIWMRLQDQDLSTLELIPSRFDNEGDLRKMFVTITDEEAGYLQLQGIERYRIKADGYDKVAVPLWIILKLQQEIQKTSVDDAHLDKVKTLRKSEVPSA